MTGAVAFAFWQAEREVNSLSLDARNGGNGIVAVEVHP